MRSRFLRVVCAAGLLSCFVVGCGGDGFNRVPIAGTVICEGMENPSGGLMATSADAGAGAPNLSWVIEAGKFTIPADQGPVPGSYIFEISLPAPGVEAPDPSEAPEGERETGPTVTYRKTVDIPEGGSDSLSIELTSADLVGDEARPRSGEI